MCYLHSWFHSFSWFETVTSYYENFFWELYVLCVLMNVFEQRLLNVCFAHDTLLKSFLLRASIQGYFSAHILLSLSAMFVTLIPSRSSLFLWLQDITLLWFSFSLFACSFSVLSPPLNVKSSRVWLWPLALLPLLTFPKTVSEQQQQKTQVFLLTATSHSPWLNDLWNFMFSTSLLDVKMIDPIDFLLSLPNF